MKFFVSSRLYYGVSGPSTLLCSLSCIQTAGQSVLEESLVTSREVERSDLAVGMEENRFTKLDVSDPGDLQVSYEATVETTVNTRDISEMESHSVKQMDASVLPYLFPSRYAPADRLRAVAFDLFGQYPSPYEKVMAIEDWLFQHITYQVGSSEEQTWAPDTLESRAGVCRDFAHLGIAFCRALTIPARYLTVYAHQLQPQDFHAVFEAYINGAWYVIDGTRKAPLNGMVKIAMGRDASDAAVASLFGDIMGQGIEVQSMLAAAETESFLPLDRERLRSKGQVLYLS